MADPQTHQTTCLYCGKPYTIGPDHCPHCLAPAHLRPQSQLRRFRWLFIFLALFCLVIVLWLPR